MRLLRRIVVPVLAALALTGCAEDGMQMCGDGIRGPFEACDDGNVVEGDGCDANCEIESDPGILPTLASIQQKVFTPKCAWCHSSTGAAPMDLDTEERSYESLVGVVSLLNYPKKRVEPFEPDLSVLVLKIDPSGGDPVSGGQMPLNGDPLNQEEIDTIRQWIEDGALP